MADLAFASPDNHDRAAQLAMAMYEHITEASLAGLPFADVAAAVAMLNGMLLAGAYSNKADRVAGARAIAKVAIERAGRLDKVPRVPFGAPPAGSA